MPRNPFAVKRQGTAIEEFGLKHSVNPQITYSNAFAEWEAATAAGLDLWRWDSGEYPVSFMSKVLAWFRYHNLVQVHTHDAAMRKAEQRRK